MPNPFNYDTESKRWCDECSREIDLWEPIYQCPDCPDLICEECFYIDDRSGDEV